MSIRWAALAGLAALLLAACGVGEASETTVLEAPSVEPAPVETAASVPADHLAAISSYWGAREAAFLQSPTEGVGFIVDRLHPDLDYSTADCMAAWFGDAASASFVERSTPDLDSVALMDDWVMTIGARTIEPGAGVYRVEVELSYEGTPTWWPDRRVAAFLQVADGQVRNFVRCEAAQVQAAQTSELRTAPAPAKQPVETLVRTASVRSLMADDGTVTVASTPECPNPRIEVHNDTAFIYCPRPASDAPEPGQPGAPAPAEPTEPTGSRPPGTGLDFCRGDGGEREQAGDYYTCGYDEREPRASD